jgi:Trk K+ transport system NAD-binding subunit
MTTDHSTDDSGDAHTRTTHFVLGGGNLGAAIAERLRREGHTVTTVDVPTRLTDELSAARGDDDQRIVGDPRDVDLLAAAGVETASSVIVATQSDARNFLVAQLVRVNFDVPRIVVLVHDPTRTEPLADAGHEPLCVTATVSETITEQI